MMAPEWLVFVLIVILGVGIGVVIYEIARPLGWRWRTRLSKTDPARAAQDEFRRAMRKPKAPHQSDAADD